MTLANRRMRSDVCGLPTPHWTRRCWQCAPRSQVTPGSVLQAVHASRGKFITARPLDVSSKSKHLQNTLHLAPYESGSQKSHVSGAVHDILGHGLSATRTPLCVVDARVAQTVQAQSLASSMASLASSIYSKITLSWRSLFQSAWRAQ